MLTRAYSLLEVKAVDSSRRVITGVATTPDTDRTGDVVDPFGAKFKNPLSMLMHHDSTKPVAEVVFGRPTSAGIPFTATFPNPDEIRSDTLRERVLEAWDSVRLKLIKGVSIGFRALDGGIERMKSGGIRFSSYELLELSLVVVPANAAATIQTIKSFDLDAAHRAVSGTRSHVPSPSGVPGSSQRTAMQVSEQIDTVKHDIQTKTARLTELIEKDEAELSEDEAKEQNGLTASIKSLRSRLESLNTLEGTQAEQAAPVRFQAKTSRVTVTDHAKELPKGTLFTRYAMAKAAGKGSLSDTLEYAKRWNTQTPEVTAYIKAEAGSSVDVSPGWGSELAFQNNLAGEFVELLRPMTILGRVSGFRDAPFNSRVPVQSGGATVNWVGEKAAKPVTELEFTTTTIPYHKMAGIIVVTDELIRLSSPSAEALVRRDLSEQIAQFRDEQFIRVAVTAGSNNPASITNGVNSPAATGTTLAHLLADLNTAIGSIVSAGHSAMGLAIVTTSEVALRLSLMSNALGQTPPGFSVSPTGGTLLGYPVVVSDSVDADTLVFFKPSEIFLADDGRVSLDASNQATLDMAGGDTPNFNLWQKNCTAIRAEQWITWVKRRAGAVAIIDTIGYVPGT